MAVQASGSGSGSGGQPGLFKDRPLWLIYACAGGNQRFIVAGDIATSSGITGVNRMTVGAPRTVQANFVAISATEP